MKRIIFFFFLILQINIYSQEVEVKRLNFSNSNWQGCFLNTSTHSDCVVLVEFETCKVLNRDTLQNNIKVNVLEVLKGEIPYDSIYIRGDNKNNILQSLNKFSWYPTWIMSLYESSPKVFDIYSRGEYCIPYHCKYVIGIITDNTTWQKGKSERMHFDTLRKALAMPYKYMLPKKVKGYDDLYAAVETVCL